MTLYYVCLFCRILLKEALTEVRKQIIARPNDTVNSIVNAVIKNLPPEILQGPKIDNLKRSGQRARKRLLENLAGGITDESSTSNNASALNSMKTELEVTDVYSNNFGWGQSLLYSSSLQTGINQIQISLSSIKSLNSSFII